MHQKGAEFMRDFGKKGRGRVRNSLAGGIGIGIAVCILVSIMLCGIGAMLMDKQIFKQAWGDGITMAAHLLAALTGALVAVKIAGKRRMIVCASTGIGFFLTLMAASAAVYGGHYQGALRGLGVILGASVFSGLVGAGTGKKKGKHYKFS